MDEQSETFTTPPFDMDAEATVLSNVLCDGSRLAEVGDFLRPEHFYSEAHRRIYEAAVALSARGDTVDLVRVLSWLQDAGRLNQVGGSPYVTEVVGSAPAVIDLRPHALRVQSLWRLREMQFRARRIVAEAFVSGDDVQGYCERAAKALHEVAYAPGTSDGLGAMSSATGDSWRDLEAASGEGRTLVGLPTGIDRLDRVLGGLQAGELTILAARPGKGKSALALQAAVHVGTLGHGAAVFSLEMPKKQLAIRAMCAEARVDFARARVGMLNRTEWGRLTEARRLLDSLPLYVDETAALTCFAMRARLRRLQTKTDAAPVKLVVVDYLQLVHGTAESKKQNREREVAEVAQSTKELAKEFNLHVMACCQMNRDVENSQRRPKLRDLRESGAIEQAADNVVFLHEAPKDDQVVEIIVEKQRSGPTDVVSARFDRRYTRFDNIAEGEYVA